MSGALGLCALEEDGDILKDAEGYAVAFSVDDEGDMLRAQTFLQDQGFVVLQGVFSPKVMISDPSSTLVGLNFTYLLTFASTPPPSQSL